jgi:hypothetical protein
MPPYTFTGHVDRLMYSLTVRRSDCNPSRRFPARPPGPTPAPHARVGLPNRHDPSRTDLLAPLAVELPAPGPSIARTRERPSGGRTAAHVTDGCLRRATALRGAGDPFRLRAMGGWRARVFPPTERRQRQAHRPPGHPGRAAARSPTASLDTPTTGALGQSPPPDRREHPLRSRRAKKRATAAVTGHHGAADGQSASGSGNCPSASGYRRARRGRPTAVSSRDGAGARLACGPSSRDETERGSGSYLAAASASAIRSCCRRSSYARCRHDCRQYDRSRPVAGWCRIRPPHHSHNLAEGLCSSFMRESSPKGGSIFDRSLMSALVGQWMNTCRSMTG